MCSIPIDSLTISGVTPADSNSSLVNCLWVVLAGWHASDLQSPMLTNLVNKFNASWNWVPAGTQFQDALNLFTRLVNIGDCKSLACHPASTTHRQLTKEELESAGVTPDMVRLSIGIEHIDDLIQDLEQALS